MVEAHTILSVKMEDAVNETLIVGDEDEVRKQRGIKKRELTVKFKKLKTLLPVDLDDVFQKTGISQDIVTDHFGRIKNLRKSLGNLHDRVQLLRVPDPDEDREEELLVIEDAYLEGVEDTYYAALDMYSKYARQLTATNSEPAGEKKEPSEVQMGDGVADMEEREDELKKAITEYEVVRRSADKMVNQVEDFTFDKMVESVTIKGIAASGKLVRLQACMEEVIGLLCSFKRCVRRAGQTMDEKDIEFDHNVQRADCLELEDKLEKIVLAQEAQAQHHDSINVTRSSPSPATTSVTSPIKMAKVTLSKFSGEHRDYARWRSQFVKIVVPARPKAEVAMYLKEAVPKRFEYLFNGTEVDDYTEMMRLLDEKFADERMILDSMMTSIQKFKMPDTDPKFINFVNDVQSLHLDAKNIGKLNEYANPQTLSAIEGKFPEYVRLKWAEHVVEKGLNKKDTGQRYDAMMGFLKKAKEMAEYNGSEMTKASTSKHSVSHYCTGVTMTAKTQNPARISNSWDPCLACKNVYNRRDSLHQTSTCQKWLAMTDKQKKETVSCIKHPFRNQDGHKTQDCRGPVGAYLKKCRHCESKDHHGLFCSSIQRSRSNTVSSTEVSKTMAARTLLPPVLLQTNFVKTIKQAELGALWDLASTDDYIRTDVAQKLGLKGISVTLVVEAIKGQESVQETMLYDVPVYTRRNRKRIYKCYGLDEITSGSNIPEGYDDLCAKFGKAPGMMRRPKKIDILISMRRHRDHPKLSTTIMDMSVFDGPFGPVFGGSDECLQFKPHQLSCLVKKLQGATSAVTLRAAVKSVGLVSSLKSEREFLAYFKEDAIGVDVKPECGSCRCGQCALGAKPMSLKQERKLEQFKQNLKYEPEGVTHDPGPYWRTSYQWTRDKESLPDNYKAVYATMKRTEKKLQADSVWSQVYEQQLKDLIDNGFARELLPGELEKWTKAGGKSYYIAHQMVQNPENKSTPIRAVFNSSQMYQGYSLNSSWDLGPDMMTNLQTVLIRFRRDITGAQGDIKKMFYAIRVDEDEAFMQLWIWKFKGEEKVRVFCMERLVMGNMPSSNISIVAVHETANLFDFKTKYPDAYEALTQDSYVDNVFVTAASQDELRTKIEEVEHVCNYGGFYFKPWMKSGVCKGVKKIAGQGSSVCVYDQVEKALGVYWNMDTDEMFIKLSLTEEERSSIFWKSLKPKLTIEVPVGVRHSSEEFSTENINEEENRRSCPVATGIKRSESCPVATPTHDEGTDISDQNEVNGKFESSKFPAKQVSMMEDGSMNSSKCFLGMKDPSKDLLEYFKEESIGVECSPKCGNCICGKCALGSKKMSLANERKYADFQSRMKYDEEGTVEDPGPYFTVEEFPFIIPKEDLVDNYPAVLRVMNSTAKKLEKNELWRKVYETQLRDLVKRGFAREVFAKEVEDWELKGGKTYYIAHQMALNPQSKSTPVRTFFNSSQVYRGYSLNSSCSLGPEDIMNNMTGILLRFREDIVGAQGDITKMYYMIRISIDGQMMQLFIWRFEGEKEIRTFCMMRLTMGNKISSNFSIIAVNETAELQDFPTKFPDAYEALTKNTYVDNVLVVKPTVEEIKKTIEQIEFVSAQGGFFYKPWIISGQDVPHQVIPVALPNAVSVEEERALGMNWNVLEDTFSVNAGAVLGGGKKGGEAVTEVVEDNNSLILNPTLKLSLRICLSVHAKAYEPLGFMFPTKMVGAILFRKTLQFINAKFPVSKAECKGQKGKIRWDFQISDFGGEDNFLSSWVKYFGMLMSLEDVTFPRSHKPKHVDDNIKPDLITFSDGNEDAYGCVAYAMGLFGSIGQLGFCMMRSSGHLPEDAD